MTSTGRVAKAKKAADVLEEQGKQAREAYELRQQGMSWWDIAERLKISERQAMLRVDEAMSVAAAMVDEALKRQLLTMEVSRLDALQSAYWSAAVTGDVRSAELVLKISGQRSKLLGLDNIQVQSGTSHTVIVAGTSAEYINALQSASQPRELT
jgi:hypothetical protein